MSAITLTDEQRHVVLGEQGKHIDVVDPVTHRRYVLIPRDEFERVQPLLEPPSSVPLEPSDCISPTMLKSQQAFWRDLPQLLKFKSRKRRYVAYHGNERIGFGRSLTELTQECLRRGLARGEFYVALLEEEQTPPWVPTPLEQSLYEFTDDPRLDAGSVSE